MILSCRPLNDVSDVNSYQVVDYLDISQGENTTVYFQLMDNSKNRNCHGLKPAGLRYIPEDDATLEVTIDNLNPTKWIVRDGYQPFPEDGSIWAFDIMSTDVISGMLTLKLALTETAGTRNGRAVGILRVAF